MSKLRIITTFTLLLFGATPNLYSTDVKEHLSYFFNQISQLQQMARDIFKEVLENETFDIVTTKRLNNFLGSASITSTTISVRVATGSDDAEEDLVVLQVRTFKIASCQ